MDNINTLETRPYQLRRETNVLFCPFNTRVVVPGAVSGTIGINTAACNEMCPHFHIKKVKYNNGIEAGSPSDYKELIDIELTCSGCIVPITVEVIDAKAKPLKTGLILGK